MSHFIHLIFCSILIISQSTAHNANVRNLNAQGNANVAFKVTLETHMPEDEVVCILIYNINEFDWYKLQDKVYGMTKISENSWQITFENLELGGEYHYIYCRNFMFWGAEEEGSGYAWGGKLRSLYVNNESMTIIDTVIKWRWWPVDGIIPEIDTSNYLSVPPDNFPRPYFQYGVELPDYWWNNFRPVVPQTLDKIAENSKANWISYKPTLFITQYYPTPVIEMIIEDNDSTPEEDLIKIITEAHKRGFKFFLRPIATPHRVEDTSPGYHTQAWWIEWEKQWRPFMLYYAQLAQEHGVEMFEISMWEHTRVPENPYEEIQTIDSLACSLLKDIRAVYKDKVCVEFSVYGVDLDLFSKVDYLGTLLWPCCPYPISNSKRPTVASMVSNINIGLNKMEEGFIKREKPIVINALAAMSYDGAAMNNPSWDTVDYSFPDDPNIPIDLQEQADILEAMLQAIAKRE